MHGVGDCALLRHQERRTRHSSVTTEQVLHVAPAAVSERHGHVQAAAGPLRIRLHTARRCVKGPRKRAPPAFAERRLQTCTPACPAPCAQPRRRASALRCASAACPPSSPRVPSPACLAQQARVGAPRLTAPRTPPQAEAAPAARLRQVLSCGAAWSCAPGTRCQPDAGSVTMQRLPRHLRLNLGPRWSGGCGAAQAARRRLSLESLAPPPGRPRRFGGAVVARDLVKPRGERQCWAVRPQQLLPACRCRRLLPQQVPAQEACHGRAGAVFIEQGSAAPQRPGDCASSCACAAQPVMKGAGELSMCVCSRTPRATPGRRETRALSSSCAPPSSSSAACFAFFFFFFGATSTPPACST